MGIFHKKRYEYNTQFGGEMSEYKKSNQKSQGWSNIWRLVKIRKILIIFSFFYTKLLI